MFDLNFNEKLTLKVWQELHEKDCNPPTVTTGERYQFEFIPSGIGTHSFILCLACKERKNLTDYTCW